MGDDASDRVTCAVTDGVADVRLNRPGKLNALDPQAFAALEEAGRRVGEDPSVRAVVLSGEGRGFCAGLDVAAFEAMTDASQARAMGDSLTGGADGQAPEPGPSWAQRCVLVWTDLAVPVIAAVHGVALGAGLQIALAADLRVVAPDAQLAVLEIRWGLIPDMTATVQLPRLVPLDVAKELVWTGRVVSGEEAVRLGLATRVSADPRAEALALAAELARQSPDAVRAAKVLLNQSGRVSRAEQLAAEARAMASLIGSANQAEAVRAYFERRAPVFTDP
jgi:enoyl-CoA hydratase/carnithine racemase